MYINKYKYIFPPENCLVINGTAGDNVFSILFICLSKFKHEFYECIHLFRYLIHYSFRPSLNKQFLSVTPMYQTQFCVLGYNIKTYVTY